MAKARKPIGVSLEAARALAVTKQGLDKRPEAADRSSLLEAIHRIGLLQLDTVNVVARSHYLVMLSRMGLYDRAELDALLYPDRTLFEGWAHAACLIPVEHYPYFVPGILARRNQPLDNWVYEYIGPNPQEVLDAVLAEVRDRGPLASKDFEDPRDHREPWWGYKPAKHALVLHFRRGNLMVDRREKFQIYYDLPERVMPGSTQPVELTTQEFERWATLKGLRHLGVATAPHICDYYRIKVSVVRPLLKRLVKEGKVIQVEVEEWREPAYLHVEDLPLLDHSDDSAEVTTFLSPFDNLTWNRDRLQELFGFDYRLEIYVPQAKRKFGYYVMPILHNGRFVGRLDPKVDRKAKIMIIRNLYLEDGVELDDSLMSGMTTAIREFMSFHLCQGLAIENCQSPSLVRELMSRV